VSFGTKKWRVYCLCGKWISEHRFWLVARFVAWLEDEDYGHQAYVVRRRDA
jgi:hypothetical protein